MRIITYGQTNNWTSENLIPKLQNGSEWFQPCKDYEEIDATVKTMDANIGRPFIRDILERTLEEQTNDKKSEQEAERIFFVIGDQQFGWRDGEDEGKQDLEELVRRKMKEAKGNLRIYPVFVGPIIVDSKCFKEMARAGNGQVLHFPGSVNYSIDSIKFTYSGNWRT